MRVLQIVEPIISANTSADGTERTVTEGSLIRDLNTGELLTLDLDSLGQHHGMNLLWPDPLCVISTVLPFSVFSVLL